MRSIMRTCALALTLVLFLTACGSDEDASDTIAEPSGPGLALVGLSGNDIVINQLWIQGCTPGLDGIDWQDSRRVLVGETEPFQLITTQTDFQNDSTEPDCVNGRVGSSTFSQSVEAVNQQVAFNWTDETGAPAEAPAGMEDTVVANGMEGIMTAASVTPETDERADQLNAAEFCGVSNWEAGESQDTLVCFNGGEPQIGRTVMIIDDTTFPWANYQASNFGSYNEDGFAIDVSNMIPFEGPFLPPNG